MRDQENQSKGLIINGILLFIVTSAFFILLAFSFRIRGDDRMNNQQIFELYSHSFYEGEGDGDVNLTALHQLSRGLEEYLSPSLGTELNQLRTEFNTVLHEYELLTSREERKKAVADLKRILIQLNREYSDQMEVRETAFIRMIYFLFIAMGLQLIIFLRTILSVKATQREIRNRGNIIGLLQKAREEEKQRLASQLHDTVLQDLGEIRLKLGNTNEGLAIKESQDRIRGITYDLVPVHLDQLGLYEAVRDLADHMFGKSYVFEMHKYGYNESLISLDHKLILFRMIQECLNNIRKHAGTDHFEIKFTASHPHVIISVTDHGTGFATDRTGDRDMTQGGLGLSLLQLQSRQMKGTMQVRSEPGKGTEIRIRIPTRKDND